MKTEEMTDMPRVRIVVLGKINVGKSALTVRYLTRRFIGEYRSNTDLLYHKIVTVKNTPLEVEILDVSGETRDSTLPLEYVQWADAYVVVYSITDKQSFEYAQEVLKDLPNLRPDSTLPVTLLANKLDLVHLREVEEMDGRKASITNSCHFFEVSVADNSADLYQAFEVLVNECRRLQGNANNGHHKSRKFSVSKMIGTLIGSGNNSNGKNGSVGNQTQQQNQGGTVVVFQISDLYRNQVLKRRQKFTATASL